MRLLFAHQSFPAQYKHVARHFADTGHEVVALRQDLGRDIPGVRSVVYRPADTGRPTEDRFVSHSESPLRNAQAVLEKARELKAQGFTPDVMIGHNAWGETLFLKDVWPDAPLLSYFEYFYARPGGDADFDPEFPPGQNSRPHGRVMNGINLLGLQTTDWGQAPTYWQRSRYPELYHPKISVIHEGIDTDQLAPRPGIQVTLPDGRTTLSRKDEVITYVSRNLEPYRGFHTFMRSLPEIQRRRPNAHVVLVGGDGVSYGPPLSDGRSFKEALLQEQKANLDLSRIHFLGQVPYEQFLAVLQLSSVHVYLTYPFVLSWSMLEAMSTGCLVIGSRTPPVEEIITDGVDGLLVDFFDRKGLADRIDAVLDHPDRMQSLRDAARRTIVERYDLRRVCLPRHLKLIEDLANRRTPQVPPQVCAKMPPRPDDEMFPITVQTPAPVAPVPAPVPAPQPQPQPQPAGQLAPGQVTVEQAIQMAAVASRDGDRAKAEQILVTVIQQHPHNHLAHYRLGLLCHEQNRYPEAAKLLEKAVELNPQDPNYHCDLGYMYKQLKDVPRRLACYRRALEIDPKNLAAMTNMASALNDVGDPEGAEVVCRKALEIDVRNFAATVNLGTSLMHQNRLEEAEKAFLRARSIDPNYSEGDKNIGMCLMLKGDFRRGAKYYEGRIKSTTDDLRRPYKQPQWDGRKLKGKTLFLHCEQGLGDTINLVRYAALAKKRGARVVVECQKPLVPMVRSVPGIDQVVTDGDPLPRFDTWRSLMSLPFVFGHDIADIPADVPYMTAPADALETWRARLGAPGGERFKVGIAWAGSPTHGNDHRRSMHLEQLKPLLDVPGVDVYSIQKGPAQAQIAELGLSGRIPDLGAEIADFGETAAVMECLDLVIAVDTSVVHMAGALGRPVWVLIPFHPDWRWLLDREDSPWYPTMRLLRQGTDRAWGPVIDRTVTDLRALAARPAPVAG